MILGIHPFYQTLLGTLFTWGVTALGASLCCINAINDQEKVLSTSLGFASGVMLAATFWSLLVPALEYAEDIGYGEYGWLCVGLGFVLGAVFVGLSDRFLSFSNHLRMLTLSKKRETKSGRSDYHNVLLIILAITIHNIPEGLSVGVAFSALSMNGTSSHHFLNARNLALSIGIQNFPEGLAVSLPLHASGFSFRKSLFYGQLSGFVEPLAGILGCLTVQLSSALLPFALSFAGGAMFFVVLDNIVPDYQKRRYPKLGSVMSTVGFTAMMALEVGLS